MARGRKTGGRSKGTPNKVAPKRESLDSLGLDAIALRLEAGQSIAQLAASLKLTPGYLREWIAADGEREQRCADARRHAAECYADKAETVLLEARTPAQIAQARELAHHYRWRAKVQDPTRFGDKLALDTSVKVQDLSDAQLDARIAKLAGQFGFATATAIVAGAADGEGAAGAAAAGETAP